MTWDHRVVRRSDGQLAFVEVSYDQRGALIGYSEPFMHGDTTQELSTLIERLKEALAQPVINASEFEEE